MKKRRIRALKTEVNAVMTTGLMPETRTLLNMYPSPKKPQDNKASAVPFMA